MRFVTLAAFVLVACPGPDIADPVLVDVFGVVSDFYLAMALVDGAWILLDNGDEQLGVRTGADGSFSISGVPGDRPTSLTVAYEGHLAVTYGGLMLGEVSQPLDLRTQARELYRVYDN